MMFDRRIKYVIFNVPKSDIVNNSYAFMVGQILILN